MKVSLNWIKEFTEVTLPINELVEKVGAQLGAVEEVVNLGEKYDAITVVKVVSCEKHPNADKLHVCLIDDDRFIEGVERNEQNLVQVVCGAPNVRAGMLATWIPPGNKVPATFDKDPFVLEVRDIRGVKSNGMLASPKELALGNNHKGILEVDQGTQLGVPLSEVYGLEDYIIDIENKMFTHRPDLFGQLGVAREIAGIQNKKFMSPDWYVNPQVPDNNKSETIQSYGVTNEIPELCSRYMLIGIDNVTIAPSPVWLQSYLSRVGIRPINNIVDMTNYMMMLTGQPLHAFDFDKVAKNGDAQIIVRKPHGGEKMTLLDGKEITPRADAILICGTEKPIALGGVMGGNNSEIDENTKRILIECANFDMYNIRRTAMEHGIFSDAVTRFIKGQSFAQCPAVLYRAVQMVQELCKDARPIGEAVDLNQSSRQNQPVTAKADYINSRLGLKLSAEEMTELLSNVEFRVEASNDSLVITAPFWRTDIEIPEDIVEEVGRLYGYDKLPLELPKRNLTPAPKDSLLELKAKLRELLSQSGANEVLTYNFVHGNLLDKVGQNKSLAFQLSNALSPELQYYRLSLTPSLLEKVHPNIKAGYDQFALFELGKVHSKTEIDEDGVPREFGRVGLVFAADNKTAQHEYGGTAYYQARKYLDFVLRHYRLALKFVPLKDVSYENHELLKQMSEPFEPTRSAALYNGELLVGLVGEYKAKVRSGLKLPIFSAGFEVFLSLFKQDDKSNYIPLPRYPKVEQDICLKVTADLPYQELFNFVKQTIDEAKPKPTFTVLSPIDIYQRDDDLGHKQITLRLSIASYEKTMTDSEVSVLLDHVAGAAKEKFAAERM